MPVPPAVVELVEQFDRNLAAYKSGKYNETQVRVEFIDPLFKALGWDVHNQQGYAQAHGCPRPAYARPAQTACRRHAATAKIHAVKPNRSDRWADRPLGL